MIENYGVCGRAECIRFVFAHTDRMWQLNGQSARAEAKQQESAPLWIVLCSLDEDCENEAELEGS
jgi:hypothetical protein